MNHRLIIIPLLAAILAQAVLGGFRGGWAVCLGHGERAILATAPPAPLASSTETCSGTCCPGHGSEWPSPVPADHSEHDGCGCTDIALSFDPIGLSGAFPEFVRLAPARITSMPLLRSLAGATVDHDGWSRFQSADDEGQAGRLVVVRATRLQV